MVGWEFNRGVPRKAAPLWYPSHGSTILSSSDGALFTMTGPFLKRENFTATFDVYCPEMAARSLMFAASFGKYYQEALFFSEEN